jgi:hypothetical protein
MYVSVNYQIVRNRLECDYCDLEFFFIFNVYDAMWPSIRCARLREYFNIYYCENSTKIATKNYPYI